MLLKKEKITIQLHVVQVPNHKKITKILQLFQNLNKRDIPGGLWAVGVFGGGVAGDFVAVLM